MFVQLAPCFRTATFVVQQKTSLTADHIPSKGFFHRTIFTLPMPRARVTAVTNSVGGSLPSFFQGQPT